MKVACFANQFGVSEGHGLARYARELHSALSELDGLEVTPVAGWSSMKTEDLARTQRKTGLRLTGLGRRGTSLAWTFLNTPPLEALIPQHIDVVHAVALGYPVATRKPLVVTIHDLGPLTHPEFFQNTRPWVMKRSLEQAIHQASAIVCVSQTTADEVRGYVGSQIDDRLKVVLEGVDERFFSSVEPSILNDLPLPEKDVPFILSAGAISPRKNVKGLLQAMSRLLQDIPHHLVLIGGAGWDTDELRHSMNDPALKSRVHFLGFVSDIQLRALYQEAEAYVHPSLYEGFGLPVLEAMASGTPVIASDISSLREIAGSAGRLTNANNPETLAASIVEICQSSAIQAEMSQAGRDHARGFEWSKCARAMKGIYADIID